MFGGLTPRTVASSELGCFSAPSFRLAIAQGFAIALDDFVPGQGQDRLLPLATYVKIDALAVDPAGLARAVRTCRRHPHLRLVAERLETDDHLRVARDLGFDYFQGYVLGRPEVISMVALAPSRQRRLDLLGLQVDAEVPVRSAVSLVTGDPAQTDLLPDLSGLSAVAEKLEQVPNIAVCRLSELDIVRHPLVASMLGVL